MTTRPGYSPDDEATDETYSGDYLENIYHQWLTKFEQGTNNTEKLKADILAYMKAYQYERSYFDAACAQMEALAQRAGGNALREIRKIFAEIYAEYQNQPRS